MASNSPPPPRTPAAAVLSRLINLDTAVSLHLYTLFQPIIPFSVLKSLEYSGDGRLFFPIILSVLLTSTPVAALTATPTNPSTLLLTNLLIGALVDLLLIGLTKHLIQRPRPVYNKNMFLSFAVDHWSFPSGHASRVSLIATFCVLYCNQVTEVLLVKYLNFDSGSAVVQYFVVAVGLWASITSLSRVLLGRHFLLDVVAGACLGVLEGVLVFRFFNYENLRSLIWMPSKLRFVLGVVLLYALILPIYMKDKRKERSGSNGKGKVLGPHLDEKLVDMHSPLLMCRASLGDRS